MEKPWKEDHYEALAQLLEKTNEAEWLWQKTQNGSRCRVTRGDLKVLESNARI